MNKIALYILLVICYLGLAKSFSPTELGVSYITNREDLSLLANDAPVSVILTDMHSTGFIIKTHYHKYRVVYGFKAPDEIVVRASKKLTLENKKYILSLPKILKNNEMNFFKWSIYKPLKINKYGIPEPISDKKIDPNILLIPLVGFDDKLNRLGYGGGYYDRYLSRLKLGNSLLKIGVGFSFQKVKNLPTNKFDQKLDYIITEKKII